MNEILLPGRITSLCRRYGIPSAYHSMILYELIRCHVPQANGDTTLIDLGKSPPWRLHLSDTTPRRIQELYRPLAGHPLPGLANKLRRILREITGKPLRPETGYALEIPPPVIQDRVLDVRPIGATFDYSLHVRCLFAYDPLRDCLYLGGLMVCDDREKPVCFSESETAKKADPDTDVTHAEGTPVTPDEPAENGR